MFSTHNSVGSASTLEVPARTSAKARELANSFSQQLTTAVKGEAKGGPPAGSKMNAAASRNYGDSQFLAARAPVPEATGVATALPSTASPEAIPSMLGMGPVAGARPVSPVTNPQPANTAPVPEADAYWAQQPKAVQALRDMPDGEAKDKLALSLANQGYSIDTQIMVWGWDPQMTMTVRENQGYAWVPSYGQSNVPVGPGISDPYEPVSYDPSSPPPGSIRVSTAFAAGTIQNPLVQQTTT